MRELIPGVGDRTARQRLRDLEKKAGTLPVIFALLFTEGVKTFVAGLPIPFVPETAWFHFILQGLKFILLSLVVAWAYVYEDERREYTEKAKEKATDTKDKVKDKAKEAKDKAKDKKEGDS